MTDQATTETICLGSSDIAISPLGMGTWAWGDRLVWGYGRGDYGAADLAAAFDACLLAGVNFVDTAESYGRGRSERFIGEFLARTSTGVVVATKFFPYPWRLSKGSLLPALQASLERLGLSRVDLYQMHWPFPPVSIETWMAALADAVEAGLIATVGVSNYNLAQTRRAQTALAGRGIPLSSNQVHYSLLQRAPEHSGLLDYCHEHKITLIAYSPLEMGLLTGKYTPEHRPPGLRGLRHRPAALQRLQPLLAMLRDIGQAHGNKTPSQVALNWVICKGAVPIPGAKNLHQATENAQALGWRLSPEEVRALDEIM